MTTQYSFDNNWQDARQRLTLIEYLHDEVTFELLERVFKDEKINTCWEIGGGSGSVAKWMATRLGNDGKVVVSDINTSLLEELRTTTIEVLCQNVAETQPDQLFDLIHARAVFCHIQNRESVLEKVINKLNPGGHLLLEDPDFISLSPIPTTKDQDVKLFEKVLKSISCYQESRGGMSHTFGADLAYVIEKMGLKSIRSEGRYAFIKGGDKGSTFFKLTYQQIAEDFLMMDACPVSKEEYLAFLALLDCPDFYFRSYTMCSVLARKA